MASTYVNDLRLNEMATGDASGTWGTNTNTNLELIAEAFSYGSEAIADASTHTITIADGSTDEARSFYLKCTGGGQACTVTLAPNTVSKVWIVENATSYTLTFSQGSSGANVAVSAGQVKMIATDGGGASAGIVYDLLTDVDLAGTTTAATLTASGTVTAATLTASGVITGSTVEATGDTSAGDNAAMGYTAAEGLILTGQGSTNDVTIKNDADADVIEIPTGTTNVTVAGTLGTGGAITSGAGLLIADAGYIGSASDTDAIQIEADGDVVMSQDLAISGTLGVTGETTLATHLNMGDNDIIKLGASSDLQLYHDGSNSYVQDAGTGLLVIKGSQVNVNSAGDESMAAFVENGAVSLYYDNAVKLATASGGVSITGNATFADDGTVIFGAGSDLQIKHNGTNSIIDNNTGSLLIQSDALTLESDSGEDYLTAAVNGAVTLFYDNASKLATASGGVNVTGTLTATTEVTVSSDVRFKSNIETIDSALDKVKAMRGVYFDKKDKRSVGVIAQEMQEVMPEVVVTDDTEDKHLSVAYGNLVGVLIEAVKELSEEVSVLRNNVQTIKFEDS